MTDGQLRAIRELEGIRAADPDGFQITLPPTELERKIVCAISLRLGPLRTADGGLDLREREEFLLSIPADFPFEYPSIFVTHNRFAGFPHVVWSKTLCLFQSNIEWNPSDGLYGYFERLRLWLGKAALNDMDPTEGPLEPPHHNTDFSQLPFVIRCNAPVAAGEAWVGVAELEKHPNRVELLGWNDLSSEWPRDRFLALAVILKKPLPMEFPSKGSEFLAELMKQGLELDQILRYLAYASLFSPKGEPIHLILGLPMRRAADGIPRMHFAVWTTSPEFSTTLRATLPQDTDDDAIKNLRKDVAEYLKTRFENESVKWCRVFEDREEIVVRRDAGRALSWFTGKKVLLLGCGALGSWAAEMIARTNPSYLALVDNTLVKPGLLARQNYILGDIAFPKAEALAKRLKSLVNGIVIEHFILDAHKFLTEHQESLTQYDIIIDCTANSIFHMKLERDWEMFERHTPSVMSFVTDSLAHSLLGVILEKGSTGGIWDAYIRLKQRVCAQEHRKSIISSFYSAEALENLFQPEPGCSDPTFSGSTADVVSLMSNALNLAMDQKPSVNQPIGMAFSLHNSDGKPGTLDVLTLPEIEEVLVGKYRVRILSGVHTQARSWVRQNARIRSPYHETGGLLWGFWDDAAKVVWIFDISGPPSDSIHSEGEFICGALGTVEEHKRRFKQSHGAVGFVGFWHTHPNMSSRQSHVDLNGMLRLVSRIGENQKRALMLIFGSSRDGGTADIHVYESQSAGRAAELVSIGVTQTKLAKAVV